MLMRSRTTFVDAPGPTQVNYAPWSIERIHGRKRAKRFGTWHLVALWAKSTLLPQQLKATPILAALFQTALSALITRLLDPSTSLIASTHRADMRSLTSLSFCLHATAHLVLVSASRRICLPRTFRATCAPSRH